MSLYILSVSLGYGCAFLSSLRVDWSRLIDCLVVHALPYYLVFRFVDKVKFR